MKTNFQTYESHAREIRKNVVKMVASGKAAHIGGALSVVDILAVLYFGILRVRPKNPNWSNRDRFILSKGHAATALYSVLAQRGFASKKILEKYYQDGCSLAGHPIKGCMPGIEVSTGSLGHGLPIGLGMALAGKHGKKPYRVFVVLSEGDCNSGSTWEAAMLASHLKLDNLVAIHDYNKIQAMGYSREIMGLDPLPDKWQAFGWSTKEIDGHNYQQIEKALTKIPFKKNKPSVVIAHTVKGKGVSFMEDSLAWHYQWPNEEQLKRALKELERN